MKKYDDEYSPAPILTGETPSEFRRDSDPLKRMKTIGMIGSVALLTNNITGPGMITQAMDSTIVEVFGRSCAFMFYDVSKNETLLDCHGPWCCVDHLAAEPTDSPFGNAYVFSAGFLVVLCITIPIGFFNLDDNIWLQVGGIIVLFACIVLWIGVFFQEGLEPSRMPAFGGSYGTVLSVVMFNFSYVMTLPSWLNEKRPNVSIHRSVSIAVTIAVTLFLLLGLLGGMSLDYGNGDLLSAIDALGSKELYGKVGTYLFPPAALLTSIPVFSIIIRYNLVENDVCGPLVANLFAVVLPWVVALFFFAGSLLQQLINWSSAILFVELNFLMPLLLYVFMARRRRLLDAACIAPSTFRAPKKGLGDEYSPILTKDSSAAVGLVNYAIDDEEYDADDIITENSHLHVLPACARKCCTERSFAWVLVWLAIVISIATLVLQIVFD